jgi:ribonuclease III
MQPSIQALEEKLGYRFRDPDLLVHALTHSSWLSDPGSPAPENNDNERLEFLGDAILGFVVSEALVIRHPSLREGQLSKLKAHLVSATHLHRCAVNLGLGDHLLLGRGEERSGGRGRKTLLANALEAVIAAVHMDGGIEAARALIKQQVLGGLETVDEVESIDLLNYKSVLQERARALGLPAPRYEIVETSGPDHATLFTVEATIGERFRGRGSGSSKKGAGQQAAQKMLEQMDSAENSELATSTGYREAD